MIPCFLSLSVLRRAGEARFCRPGVWRTRFASRTGHSTSSVDGLIVFREKCAYIRWTILRELGRCQRRLARKSSVVLTGLLQLELYATTWKPFAANLSARSCMHSREVRQCETVKHAWLTLLLINGVPNWRMIDHLLTCADDRLVLGICTNRSTDVGWHTDNCLNST